MGLRVKSMNWVVERVSKVRRFRRLIGDIDEFSRFLGVVNGGRDGFGGEKGTVREEHINGIMACLWSKLSIPYNSLDGYQLHCTYPKINDMSCDDKRPPFCK